MRNCRRRVPGFTLIELLVVIAIIGVLIGLLVPAVQQVRESANRASCMNNLKNIGLAVHNFADAYKALPPGRVNTRTGLPLLGVPPKPTGTVPSHSWVPFVLPYLEQKPLYEQYHRDRNWPDPLNRPAVNSTQLTILQCPSTPQANRLHVEAFPATSATVGQAWGACIDYAAVKGIRTGAGTLATSGLIDPLANALAAEGCMPDSAMRRLIQISDGTSNTVMIVECAGRPQLWRAGQPVPLATLDPSNARYPIEDAAGGDMPGGAWAEQQNAFFLDGSTLDGKLKPGPCAINCTNNYCGLPTRNYDDGEVYSFHPGGALGVFADGSVHFFQASIDIRIFARLVTRAGGDVVGSSDF